MSDQEWLEATLAKCQETPGPLRTPCMVWKGRSLSKQYPMCHRKGKYGSRHRFVWQIVSRMMGRPEPSGRYAVHHVCENPSCLNPGHLEALSYWQHWHTHFRPAATAQ